MASSIFYDLQSLPEEALSYTDLKFYDMVRDLLGCSHARLLQFQHINSVPCFLLTDDVCDVLKMEIDDTELDAIRDEICYKLKSGGYVVKGGIQTSFRCFKEFLLKKTEEKMKQLKYKRKDTTTMTSPNTLTQTQLTTTTILSQATTVSSPSSMTSEQHKQQLIELTKEWCNDSRDSFELKKLMLVEGNDYFLNVLDTGNVLEANVVCKCGIKTVLCKNVDKFTMSNYYRHLRNTKCSLLKNLKKKEEEEDLQQQQAATRAAGMSHQQPVIQIITTTPVAVQSPSSISTPSASSVTTRAKRSNDSQTNTPAKRTKK
ncbi:unnamed protein product [Didymodactylos carnosus]|uniref:Uncharacterized protein n=1 Tax=Didymodactylos carnosus TaxID=1234261 RepID=A0A814LWI7_9BILA|nr:unnamed protein product [Didymodactylos carnosus]CAF1180305.1 unnamed protein product [Didymodactylos carnosus]CAF3836046.1 unnamed protein product [Didymodactylos carnosus]CAF3991575.1 unnamed protein product [Didymodactylos carnosus]